MYVYRVNYYRKVWAKIVKKGILECGRKIDFEYESKGYFRKSHSLIGQGHFQLHFNDGVGEVLFDSIAIPFKVKRFILKETLEVELDSNYKIDGLDFVRSRNSNSSKYAVFYQKSKIVGAFEISSDDVQLPYACKNVNDSVVDEIKMVASTLEPRLIPFLLFYATKIETGS